MKTRTIQHKELMFKLINKGIIKPSKIQKYECL